MRIAKGHKRIDSHEHVLSIVDVLVCIQMLLRNKNSWTINGVSLKCNFSRSWWQIYARLAGNVDALAFWNTSSLAFFNVH